MVVLVNQRYIIDIFFKTKTYIEAIQRRCSFNENGSNPNSTALLILMIFQILLDNFSTTVYYKIDFSSNKNYYFL